MTYSPNTARPEEYKPTEAELLQSTVWYASMYNAHLAEKWKSGLMTIEEGRRLEQGKQIGQWGNVPGELLA